MEDNFTTMVVGVTWVPGYPENLHYLDLIVRRAAKRGERVMVVLHHNQANVSDANAVEVNIPELGSVGHLPRHLAAELAPLLDAGEPWDAEVAEVRVSDEHYDHPGLDVHIWKEP